jgi:hypothetical protein
MERAKFAQNGAKAGIMPASFSMQDFAEQLFAQKPPLLLDRAGKQD